MATALPWHAAADRVRQPRVQGDHVEQAAAVKESRSPKAEGARTMNGRSARSLPAVVEVRLALTAAIEFGGEINMAREAWARKAIANRQWSELLRLSMRGNRWAIFRTVKPYLSDVEYWPLLRDVWDDSESVGMQRDIGRLLRARRGGRKTMMTDNERTRLAVLPEVVTVYRGCRDHNRMGWSWALDATRAHWFARRWLRSGLLLCGRVARTAIVALFDGRKEDEVICDPRTVALFAVEEVKAEPYEPPSTAFSYAAAEHKRLETIAEQERRKTIARIVTAVRSLLARDHNQCVASG